MVSGAGSRQLTAQLNPFAFANVQTDRFRELRGQLTRELARTNIRSATGSNSLDATPFGRFGEDDLPESPQASLRFPTVQELENLSPAEKQELSQFQQLKDFQKTLRQIEEQLRRTNLLQRSKELQDNRMAVWAAYQKVQNISDKQYFLNTEMLNAQVEMNEAFFKMFEIENQTSQLTGKILDAEWLSSRSSDPRRNRNPLEILAGLVAKSVSNFGTFIAGESFQPFQSVGSIREAYIRIFDDRNAQLFNELNTIGEFQTRETLAELQLFDTEFEMEDAVKELQNVLSISESLSSSFISDDINFIATGSDE